jgi:putative transposase
MNPPRWDDLDSIRFRIAAQKVFTGTEAARCAPEGERAPAHDAFTRLLPRPPPDTEALGQEAKAFVDVGKGLWSWMIRRWTSPMPGRWIG